MGEILEKGIRRLRPLDAAGRRLRTEEDDIPVSSGTGGFPFGEEDDDITSGSREESYADEDEETKKALVGVVGHLVTKWFGNNASTGRMIKEFDDVLAQVFQVHGGSDNAVNLRTPGQPPGKIPASPGQSGSSTGRAGPGRGTGYSGEGKVEDDEYENPSQVGSGHIASDAGEQYGRVSQQSASGLRTTWDSKPRGNYSIPAGYSGSGANRQIGQRVIRHPSTASDVPLGTYETSTYLESVQLPSNLPPMKKAKEIEKAETRQIIKSLVKSIFEEEDETNMRQPGSGLESYPYGQTQPSRNEEEAFARRKEEDEKKERFRELEAEASKYEQLAARPMMDEDERESYRKTAMSLHQQASAVLKGGNIQSGLSTWRTSALDGQAIVMPAGRKSTRVAGSRGSVVK
jgi:hypothetical protein